MHSSQITHERAADHDVVEVGDDKICVGDVDVDAECGEEQSGKATHGKQADKTEGVQHGRVVMDGTFVESCSPVKHFDRRWDGDRIAEQREHDRRVNGNSCDEHVVSPDQKAEDGDGDRGKCDEAVTEDALTGKAGNDLGNHAHRRQNHNVNGGMGIKPKQVLEKEGIAAQLGIEDAEVQRAFGDNQHQRDGDDWCSQNLNDAGGIVCPDEEGKARPGHARCTHAMDGDDEIQSGKNG